MRILKPYILLCLMVIGLASFAFQNCSRQDFKNEVGISKENSNRSIQTDLEQQMNLIKEEIAPMSSDLSCKKDTDCQSIAFGAKPCGGPRRYLIYSVQNLAPSGVTKLKSLVSDYNKLDNEYNIVAELAGTCDFIEKPNLTCKADFCAQTNLGYQQMAPF